MCLTTLSVTCEPSPCRELGIFWDSTLRLYRAGDLPPDFFEKKSVWLTRAATYMQLVEPIEIANYYRCELWKGWPVRRHYLEGENRPERFKFFESQCAEHYPELKERLADILDLARQEAELATPQPQ